MCLNMRCELVSHCTKHLLISEISFLLRLKKSRSVGVEHPTTHICIYGFRFIELKCSPYIAYGTDYGLGVRCPGLDSNFSPILFLVPWPSYVFPLFPNPSNFQLVFKAWDGI